MNASEKPNATNLVAAAQLQQAEPKIIAAFCALQILLIGQSWGHWMSVLTLAICFVVAYALNNPLVIALRPRVPMSVAEDVRMAGNVAVTAVIGHVDHWSVPTLVYVWAQVLAQSFFDTGGVLRRVIVFITVTAASAALDGAAPFQVASLVVSCGAGYLFVRSSIDALAHVVTQLQDQKKELENSHEHLKSMQQVAIQQEKLAGLGMLAAGVAHEINNPMSFVSSNISCLLEDLRDTPGLPDPLREYVQDILPETLKGIDRVNAIVADLRRFARGDPESIAPYDLNDEVERALRIVHNQVKYKCRVETHLGQLPKLEGHPRQISQVLINLLVNAAQAISEQGTISVTTERAHEGVAVSIRDTGVGMSADIQRRLFEPFFTTKPVGVGTGLGLSVVHGIVKAHGGHVEVESAPGKGTQFTVFLPVSPPAPRELHVETASAA